MLNDKAFGSLNNHIFTNLGFCNVHLKVPTPLQNTPKITIPANTGKTQFLNPELHELFGCFSGVFFPTTQDKTRAL